MLKKLTLGLACLAVVTALLWLFRERNRSASISCISILRDIDAAKQNWALENKKATNVVPTWDDLASKYLHENPKCPQGGTYTLGAVGELPRCSYPGHKLEQTP